MSVLNANASKAVADACVSEVERRRVAIDAGDVTTVRITVRLNPRTGSVMKVQTQIEAECDVRHN
jgi:hypothetical protein